jgi:hypothetical protein
MHSFQMKNGPKKKRLTVGPLLIRYNCRNTDVSSSCLRATNLASSSMVALRIKRQVVAQAVRSSFHRYDFFADLL